MNENRKFATTPKNMNKQNIEGKNPERKGTHYFSKVQKCQLNSQKSSTVLEVSTAITLGCGLVKRDQGECMGCWVFDLGAGSMDVFSL